MEYGFVYCIGNECMPGVYKVGMTDRAPSKRCDELSASTSVPKPFDLLFFIESAAPREVEADMHSQLGRYRVSQNREFFECDLRVINKIFLIYKVDGCAYAETCVGDTELAMLDYHRPEHEDGDDAPDDPPLPVFMRDDLPKSQGDDQANDKEF
jgi:hypothetical protein